MIRHLRPYALPFLALVGCGSISDPTKNGEHTATVTGALTGASVPANARVALIWKKGEQGGIIVGADVPVIGGKFTMALNEPPDAYFSTTDSEVVSSTVDSTVAEPPTSESGGSAPSTGTATPTPVPVPSGARVLHPRDTVSGGITGDLTAAVAGFIVYEDTNNNGQLDITDAASTTDTVIGGNKELMIVDLRGGGALDYENLRDHSGILPAQGMNLASSQGRWFALDLVELEISSTARLPTAVCIQPGTSSPLGDDVPNTTSPSPMVPPAVKCSPDGRSYWYDYSSECTPYVPPPPTLCNNGETEVTACASGTSSITTLPPGEPVPASWPCTVITEVTDGGIDAGPAPDGGVDSGP